jgi:hypothetical protein
MRTAAFFPLCALLAILAAGCSSSTAAAVTSPTTVATESFSGSLQIGGLASHAFTTTTAGTITATVTSLSVPVVVGVGIGAYSTTTGLCSLSTGANTTTGASAQIAVTSATISATVDPGTYCVEIYDPGNLASVTSFAAITGTTSFTLSIIHPT